MRYETLTVAQLRTLADRAEERGRDRVSFYFLGNLLVETVWLDPFDPHEGPQETVIEADGSYAMPVEPSRRQPAVCMIPACGCSGYAHP